MKPKEILKEIQDTEFGFNFIDMGGRQSYRHERVFSFKDNRFHEIRKALTELEELKRDVERYFELQNMWNWKQRKEWIDELDNEYVFLRTKLSKVGNEE